MRTQTLLYSTLYRSKNFFLHCPMMKMLQISISFIQVQNYCTVNNNPSQYLQKRQFRPSGNELLSSMQSSVCRNCRYFFCGFPPFDQSISILQLRRFSSVSDTNSKQCSLIKAVSSVGSDSQDKSKPEDDANDYSVDGNSRRICKLIKLGEETMENKLTEVNVRLSPQLVIKVIRNTSRHANSALRFFTWAKSQAQYSHNSAAYNEIVNIAGGSGNFEAVGSLIEEMVTKGHSLMERAFSFMLSCRSIRSVTENLVNTFSNLEHLARLAAFHSLLSFLHKQNFLAIANWVLQQMADRGQSLSVSYFNALLAARCLRRQFLEAKMLLNEMKKYGCEPNTKSYNYLLGSLCKVGKIADVCELLDLMEKSGHQPDPITYEILICHACKSNEIYGALEFLNKMIAEGLRPRFSTYAAFIKGYFHAKQFEEAYSFLVETSKKDPSADSMNYTLLASLFEKSEMMLEAQSMLIKMIEKGLIPKFSLCRKVSTSLSQNGKQDMAQELQCKFTEIRNTLTKKHTVRQNLALQMTQHGISCQICAQETI